MPYHLVVKRPFASYGVGQRITDPGEVEKHLHRPDVVRVLAEAVEAKPATASAAEG